MPSSAGVQAQQELQLLTLFNIDELRVYNLSYVTVTSKMTANQPTLRESQNYTVTEESHELPWAGTLLQPAAGSQRWGADAWHGAATVYSPVAPQQHAGVKRRVSSAAASDGLSAAIVAPAKRLQLMALENSDVTSGAPSTAARHVRFNDIGSVREAAQAGPMRHSSRSPPPSSTSRNSFDDDIELRECKSLSSAASCAVNPLDIRSIEVPANVGDSALPPIFRRAVSSGEGDRVLAAPSFGAGAAQPNGRPISAGSPSAPASSPQTSPVAIDEERQPAPLQRSRIPLAHARRTSPLVQDEDSNSDSEQQTDDDGIIDDVEASVRHGTVQVSVVPAAAVVLAEVVPPCPLPLPIARAIARGTRYSDDIPPPHADASQALIVYAPQSTAASFQQQLLQQQSAVVLPPLSEQQEQGGKAPARTARRDSRGEWSNDPVPPPGAFAPLLAASAFAAWRPSPAPQEDDDDMMQCL